VAIYRRLNDPRINKGCQGNLVYGIGGVRQQRMISGRHVLSRCQCFGRGIAYKWTGIQRGRNFRSALLRDRLFPKVCGRERQ